MDLMSTTDLDFDARRDLDPETRSALSSYHSTYSTLNSREQLQSRELLNSREAMLNSRGDALNTPNRMGTSTPGNGDQRTLDRLHAVLDPRCNPAQSCTSIKLSSSRQLVAMLDSCVWMR